MTRAHYFLWITSFQFDLGSQGCNRMLMRMRHCSLCAGYPLVHPCPSFCETTLTHCLRPINKLQPPWTNLISQFNTDFILVNSDQCSVYPKFNFKELIFRLFSKKKSIFKTQISFITRICLRHCIFYTVYSHIFS